MIKRILHQLMALPLMYNLLQAFFGIARKKRILRRLLSFDNGPGIVLDVGGGTGLYADLWPKDFKYICFDNDTIKLNGYLPKEKLSYKVCGDAVQMPFNPHSIDIVFSSSMSHHVPEHLLDKMLCEMTRVLKSEGTLVFVDAVLIPESFFNRFLWSLDRGEYPHMRLSLENIISKYFHIEQLKVFSIYYDYLLIIARKK